MSSDSDDNSWFIQEYDNVTVVDNAPYVGLRKVDSLIDYLLVYHSQSTVDAAAIVYFWSLSTSTLTST